MTFPGRYYQTTAAVCRPWPAQRPTPQIWLGEMRDDPWGEVVCRHASGWNSTPASVEGYRAKLDGLAAARRAGRDVASFDLSLEIEVLIAPDRAGSRELAERTGALAPRRAARAASRFGRRPARQLHRACPDGNSACCGCPGPAYQALGVCHFMLWFLDVPAMRGMELFAERVLPHVRALPR